MYCRRIISTARHEQVSTALQTITGFARLTLARTELVTCLDSVKAVGAHPSLSHDVR